MGPYSAVIMRAVKGRKEFRDYGWDVEKLEWPLQPPCSELLFRVRGFGDSCIVCVGLFEGAVALERVDSCG
jgi:hypothetical protein